MKVYIPTSSLNFNNILSSESVSPKRFYAQRHFGYPRWESVPENPYDDVILLYREPHGFSRPPSDMEDHPLLIELEVDADAFPEWQCGVLFSDRTIYLDPVSASFVFFTEQDKTVALSLSMSSMESKVLRLYRKRITVNTFAGEFPQLQENRNARESLRSSENEINRDRRINKIKGMLYGYYIGAYLSCSKGSVERMTVLRTISNAFASILSSTSRLPTHEQRQRLDRCFGLLLRGTKEYQCLQPREEAEIIDILQKISKAGHPDVLPFDKNKLIEGLRRDSPKEENPSLKWIEGELSRLEQKMRDERRPLEAAKEELISRDDQVVKVASVSNDGETERQLFLAWANDTLLRQEFTGKISAEQAQLADELTIKAKEVLMDSWAESPHKAFLNQLRRRVRGEQFCPEWDNGVLSSIAAVILKGDDWNVLLRFMQDCRMTDYRNAFAFYGCLNGFANLTRDFTDLVLERDTQYVMNVYSEFHGRLHGRRINWQQSVPPPQAAATLKPGLAEWVKRIWDAIKSSRLWKKSPNQQGKKEKIVDKLLVQSLNETDFLDRLENTKDCKNLAREVRRNLSTTQRTLFDDSMSNDGASYKPILADISWIISVAEECVSDGEARKILKEDLTWYVEKREKKGPTDPEYAKLYADQRNSAVIDRVRVFLENIKFHPTEKQKQCYPDKIKAYEKIDIARIVKWLKARFAE